MSINKVLLNSSVCGPPSAQQYTLKTVHSIRLLQLLACIDLLKFHGLKRPKLYLSSCYIIIAQETFLLLSRAMPNPMAKPLGKVGGNVSWVFMIILYMR